VPGDVILAEHPPTIPGGRQVVAWMEVTINEGVSPKEILGLSGRVEVSHLVYPAPCRRILVLRAIVEVPG